MSTFWSFSEDNTFHFIFVKKCSSQVQEVQQFIPKCFSWLPDIHQGAIFAL